MADCNSDGRITIPIRCEPNNAAGDFRSPGRPIIVSKTSIGFQSSNESWCSMSVRLSTTSSSRKIFGRTFVCFKVMSSSLSNACKLGSRSNGGRNELMGADELKAAYWKRF